MKLDGLALVVMVLTMFVIFLLPALVTAQEGELEGELIPAPAFTERALVIRTWNNDNSGFIAKLEAFIGNQAQLDAFQAELLPELTTEETAAVVADVKLRLRRAGLTDANAAIDEAATARAATRPTRPTVEGEIDEPLVIREN